MSKFTPVYTAGQLAGRAGLLHTVNPHPKGSYEEVLWFHAWHVATVEREEGYKIIPDLPDAESGLLMFSRKKDDEL